MNILLIVHNPSVASVLGEHLSGRGHSVDFASNGLMGMRLAKTGRFDTVMVAIKMPGMNGFSVCRAIRKAPDCPPILMLGTGDLLEERLEAFDSGADGYLAPPWNFDELSARLKVLNREQCRRVLRVGDLSYDLGTLAVRRQGQSLYLQRAQLKILRELMAAAPEPVMRGELENCLWGEGGAEVHESTLRVHVCGLRAIVDRPFDTSLIQTHHGLGYSMAAHA